MLLSRAEYIDCIAPYCSLWHFDAPGQSRSRKNNTTCRMAAPAPERPLFTLGVIADVQYADLDDGHTEGRVQRFRQAPYKLQAALNHLSTIQPSPSAVLHLGDIINGNHTPEQSNQEFDLVATIFEEASGQLPAVHVVGNHCLSVPRPVLLQRLRIPAPGYHTLRCTRRDDMQIANKAVSGRCVFIHRCLPQPCSCSLGSGWRLVVLDTTEMSGHSGYHPDSWQYKEAQVRCTFSTAEAVRACMGLLVYVGSAAPALTQPQVCQ
jgi:manganese-dependent ADP-ribose/CDP-alcohol diphosphatase